MNGLSGQAQRPLTELPFNGTQESGRSTGEFTGRLPFEGLLEATPGKYSQVLAERRGYIRFSLTNKMLRGEAVSLEGDLVDAWSQRLNRV